MHLLHSTCGRFKNSAAHTSTWSSTNVCCALSSSLVLGLLSLFVLLHLHLLCLCLSLSLPLRLPFNATFSTLLLADSVKHDPLLPQLPTSNQTDKEETRTAQQASPGAASFRQHEGLLRYRPLKPKKQRFQAVRESLYVVLSRTILNGLGPSRVLSCLGPWQRAQQRRFQCRSSSSSSSISDD